jgi:hypothetical protein
MSKLRTGKCLTYEEIGQKLEISPQQVHKIEKEAFNKIIKRLSQYPGTNIFEAIVTVSDMFGIDTDQSYKKLDAENREELCLFVEEHYGRTIDAFIKTK